MSTKIFINLPVKNLEVSRAFYTALGYSINEAFSNDQAACVIISEDIYVMILTHAFFKTFTNKKIANSKTTIEVLNCLSANSREEVDTLVRKAVAAGGTAPLEAQDHGFMYGHGFEDPDGHIWEVAYMEAQAAEVGAAAHI